MSASADSEYETTTDLKVGPNGLVVAAWVAHPAGKADTIGYAFSTDDGLTFTAPAQTTFPKNLHANEPTIAINGQGDVFLSWLGTEISGTITGKAVFVARAAAGETKFGEPVKVADGPDDLNLHRPRLGITGNGTLIEVYHYLGDDHWTAASSMDGVTWVEQELPKVGLAGGAVQRATPCTLADGAVVDRFAVVHESPTGIGLLATDDEGLTWNAVEGFPDKTSEPRCVLAGDQFYIAGNNTASIYLCAGGGGASSSWLLDKSVFGFDYLFQNVSVALDDSGSFNLAFYTHAIGGVQVKGYRALRVGASAGSPFTFTFVKQPLDVPGDFVGPASLGTYTGLATRGNFLFTSYVDNSSGISHIAFHRMALP